ncbi:MAG TPA: hypothetical protein QGF58_11960 [Myxococcota bacterium]|nr:hypothetical protein [Myxococcota bacterium]
MIWMSLSLAAPLAIHGAGEAERAAEVLGEAGAGDVELRSFAEVVPLGEPRLEGRGVLLVCEGETTHRYQVETALSTAEAHLAYVKWEEARAALEEAEAAMLCLAEPIDAATAARVHYLFGVTAAFLGDEVEARSSFARAHVLQPGLVWDTQFPQSGQDLFEQEGLLVAERPFVDLLVVPEPRAAKLTVDGRRIYAAGRRVELRAGTHIVQGPGWTVEVDLFPDSAPVFVVPEAIEDIGGDWLIDEDACRSLDQIVDAQPPLFFVAGDQAWMRDGEGWEALSDGAAASCLDLDPPPTIEGFRLPQEGAPRVVALGGAGALVGGGGVAVAGYLVAARAAQGADTWEHYQAAKPTHARGSAMLYGGEAVAIAGALALGGAIVADRTDRVQLGPGGLVVPW